MLPLLFTRHFILEAKRAKSQHRPEQMIYTDASLTIYTVDRIDTVPIPTKGKVHFEVECVLPSANQKLLFGLLSTSQIGVASKSPGLAVSVDPDAGILTDLVNDTGVLGYLEAAPLPAGEPVRIHVEMEFIRQVCLPRITIGGETFLHPALYLDGSGELSAVLGQAVVPRGGIKFRRTSVSADEALGSGAVLSA